VRGEDREGGDLDLVAGAVGRADLQVGVCRAAVADGDDEGQIVVGDRFARFVEGPEQRSPLLGSNRAQFLEALAE
jgi:hypothetical protein